MSAPAFFKMGCMALPNYFPFMHGVYDIKAGITALGKDMGNGPLDAQVFQIDEQFEVYRSAKLAGGLDPGQHLLRDELDGETELVIEAWMMDRLELEYPGQFQSRLFDSGLNGVARWIQSDMAVLQLDKQGNNRLAYLNVAMPSGWAPEDKIGKPFDQVHAPVPHIEPLNTRQDSIAKLMVNATRGAVRFAWTITTDAALNHHPHRNTAVEHPTPLPDHPAGEPLLRVERQVIWGFPQQQAALFLIRTYLYPFERLGSPVRGALVKAVAGMSEASLVYKNMDRPLILDRLA